ncbi:MAG: S8 family serine peptidase [Tidjanibacter sp.]|nr:S8 family serine peptidase [Tidjanibacter sp.]
MNRYMKQISIVATLLMALTLSGCLNDIDSPTNSGAPSEELKPYVEGELIVKFSPEVEGMLSTRSDVTRSSIPSVDKVFESVGVYEVERVFPVDSRRESVTRENGLHLWYVVRFRGESVESVEAKLSSLGEIQKVDKNRTVKRAYTGKAVPLSMDKISRAMAADNEGAAMNDELLSAQWNLINNGDLFTQDGVVKSKAGADVNILGAWAKSTGHEDVIVAVLDEGVCVEHPDLKDNIWVNEKEFLAITENSANSYEDNDGNGYAGDVNGYNFVKRMGKITWTDYLDSGHGSHVAGVISAVNNNNQGVSSIAGGDGKSGGVKIMSCQIFSGVSGASVLDVARAMKYAADNGAVILQCSWGYVSGEANIYDWGEQGFRTEEEWKEGSPLEFSALDYFIHNAGSPNGAINGGVVVFAGGNESAPAAGFPGAADFAVSVAAIAADYTPAVYTNYGVGTSISAPGGDQDYYWDYVDENHKHGEVGCILSTLPTNVSPSGYGYMEGTSMACPHISGVLALAISYATELAVQITPEQLKAWMYESARPIDEYFKGTKFYHRYVADLGPLQPMQMDLSLYANNMGTGLIDAAALLDKIGKGGTPLRFPNIYVGEGESKVEVPARYFAGGKAYSYTVTIDNQSIASCENKDDTLVFKGLQSGSTSAVLSVEGAGKSEQHTFTITVRKGAGGNGWM